ADPLDLVRLPLADPAGVVVFGEDGAVRVAADHADGRILLLQVLPRPADRAAGAGRGDEVRDPPLRLLPQLGAGRAVVRLGVRLVVELVGQDRAGRLLGDPLGHHDVVVGVVGRDGGRGHDDLGAKRLEEPHLLLAHLVRDREDAAVALDRGGNGEPDAGVAAGPFDDDAAGAEPTLALGGLDDRRADAVLDRAAGVVELRLDVDRRADAVGHAVQADQRRPADRLEDVGVGGDVATYPLLDFHGLPSSVSPNSAPSALVNLTGRRTHRLTRSSPFRPGRNRSPRAPATAALSKSACPLV